MPDSAESEKSFEATSRAERSGSAPGESPPGPVGGPAAGQSWIVPKYGMAFAYVEPGTFSMGSEEGESHERPVHSVQITRGYWLGKSAVTQREYEAIMGHNPSRFRQIWFLRLLGGGALPSHPVETVTWAAAVEFCEKLTAVERSAGRLPWPYEYRLPTEAEWEYAARGGQSSQSYAYSGSDDPDEVAWYVANSGGETHPVGEKKPNELGLCDMSGNVWELCLDWYDSAYYEKSPGIDPHGPASGSYHVTRGGGWDSRASCCRSTDRGIYSPSHTNYFLGFRVAIAPPVSSGKG